MSSISALNGLSSLSSLLSSGSGSSTASTASSSALQQLEAALSEGDTSSSASGASSFLLDLSPAAQALMSGSSSSSSASGSSTSFNLTSAQISKIESIVEQFKNDPATQATFDEIQKALAAAGLSPEQLSAQDQVKSFDPTSALLDALSGNYTAIQSPTASAENEQTKQSGYLQDILKLWQQDSKASSTSGSSSASGTATGA